MTLEIREANLEDPRDGEAFLTLLNEYARGATGGGAALDPQVRTRLLPALRAQSSALVLLAFFAGRPVGIATCFYGFSTFYARPLLNVHDLAVTPSFQGRGVGGALLAAAEERALARGCCKLTLEVREDNAAARRLYQRYGFGDLDLGGAMYATRFLSKPLVT